MHPSPARRRRALALLLAALLAPALGLAVAPSAAAHDRLLSADPEDGATLDEPPGVITLTFSAEVLPAGAQVGVTTPDGDVAADLDVDGEVVTATLPDGLPGGDYDVRWRVVSSDGHPIEGELGYTVTAGAEPTEEPSPSPTSADPSPTATSAAPSTDAHDHATGSPGVELDPAGEAGWAADWLFGVAVLAAVGVAAAWVLRQRRQRHDGEAPSDQGGSS